MRRIVAILLHPGFQLLDVAGPTAAFEIAERFRPGSYVVRLLAPGGGQVESSSGVTLSAGPTGCGATLAVMGVFSAPGYHTYFDATSVPADQAVVPFSPSELCEVRERFRNVIVFKEP